MWEKEGDLIHGDNSGYSGPGKFTSYKAVEPIPVYDPTIRTPYKLNMGYNDSDYEEVITGYTDDGRPIVKLERKWGHDFRQELEARKREENLKAMLERDKIASDQLRRKHEVEAELMRKDLAEKNLQKEYVLFQFAYYMNDYDKVRAVDNLNTSFMDGRWMHHVMKLLKSKMYPIKDWVVNKDYSCTLLNDNTILIFKTPIPKVSKPEPPKPYWREEDLVVSGLNWKRK